jgi:hypothetical protein
MSTELEQKALNRLLEGLRNLGCSYVVIDKDGADYTYGDALKRNARRKVASTAATEHCASITAHGSRTSGLVVLWRSPPSTSSLKIFSPVSAQKPSRIGALAHASLA